MGQQESSQKELIAQQFNIVRTISPGEYWVRRKKKGDELQLRLLTFYLQEEMQEYMRLLDRRKKIKNPHLLELIQHTKIHEQGMCSAAFKIRTLVQYPFKSIRDEIQERSSAHPKRFFSEDQMWSILYSCCHALYTLYLNKFNHQSLNTNQIFIDTAGIIKIADNVLVNCQKNHLSLLNESSAESTARYISPELVNLVEDNHFYFYEKEKSDVFILAMIMLQVANLEVIRYYHKKTKKFNFDQSTKARLQAQSRYSRQLTELLDSMLALDFKLRPRFEDIIAAIQQKTVYTGSSANTSLMSNEAKSNKTATIPKNGKQVDSYLNNYDYQKHERNWSLPPSNIAGSELNPTFSHFFPKTHKQYPQIIPTDSVFKFQPNRIDNFITYPIRNQSQFKHEANGPIKEATRTLPVATDTYKRDQSVTNKVQTWKIDTVFRDSGQKNQEAYTPYLQLLNLTQKTDLNKPTSNFNVAKVETVVSQPSQKPKISIKLHNSPIKNQNQVIPQVQQPFPNQPQLKPFQNLRFSQSKFGKIELPSGVVNPNTNQNLIHIQKQTQIAQVNPFQSTQVNGEGTFIIQQYEQGKFQGFKVNNKRNGVGRFIYLNGSYYQGEWKNDTIDGFGKLYYTNGQTAYEGHWRNFTFQGTGKLHNENPKITNISPIDYTDLSSIEDRWVDYEGEFSNDEKHGRGTILLANGQIFTGVFQRDVAQGEGSYYKLNGEVIQGRWAKNLYIGGL